jgi:hypothetical protein
MGYYIGLGLGREKLEVSRPTHRRVALRRCDSIASSTHICSVPINCILRRNQLRNIGLLYLYRFCWSSQNDLICVGRLNHDPALPGLQAAAYDRHYLCLNQSTHLTHAKMFEVRDISAPIHKTWNHDVIRYECARPLF